MIALFRRFCWATLLTLLLSLVSSTQAADPALDLPRDSEFEKALRLLDGDWVVFRYHGSADSGVRVSRMDAKMTEQRWRVTCPALGVEHSKYRHEVNLSRVGDRLKVVSVGSSGEFEEWLDLADGRSISRKIK